MNNDLISREALKKAISGEFDLAVCNGNIMLMSKSGIVSRILANIDNAPTVEANSIIDGLNNEIDDLSENLAWYINERNRLLKERRPQGEWIDTGSGQECNVCHEIQYGYDNFRHFCANCGADMRKGGAENG